MCFFESHSRTTVGEKPEGIGRQVGERPLDQQRAAALRPGQGIPSQTVPGSSQQGGWQAGCEGRAIKLEGLNDADYFIHAEITLLLSTY